MRGIRRRLRNWLGINRDLEDTVRKYQEIVWQLDALDGHINILRGRSADYIALHKAVHAEKVNREHLVERMQRLESVPERKHVTPAQLAVEVGHLRNEIAALRAKRG